MNNFAEKALARVKALYGTPEGEFGPTLFVAHHLEELDVEAWEKTIGIRNPEPSQILDSLVLVASWGSEDEEKVDTYDFSLPNDITDYLISVRFDGDQIAEVSMES